MTAGGDVPPIARCGDGLFATAMMALSLLFFYFLGEKEVESESVQVFGNSKGGLIARFQGSVTAIFYWCCSWNVGGVMGVRQ